MRPAHLSFVILVVLTTISFGCREDVVEELESYGVKREWIPFAPGGPVDKNYTQGFVVGADPWLLTQTVATPYTVNLDSDARSGKKALKISTLDSNAGPIWITRYEDLSDLLGKKIRFSGFVKPLDWKGTVEAGYTSDVITEDIKKISFTEPIVRNKWTGFSTEIDIPVHTQYLGLVLQLEGIGSLLIDDCSIEVIGLSASGDAPRLVKGVHANLGFEDGHSTQRNRYDILDSLIFRMPFWRTDHNPDEYKLTLDSTEPHSGRFAGGFVSVASQPRGGAMFVRELEPELVRGHRVRFDVWIKAKDIDGLATFEAVWRGSGKFDAEVKRLWDLAGTTEWKNYSIEMDVPADVSNVRVDIGYTGQGTLMVDDFSFERIKRLPDTDDLVDKSQYFAKPLNLGFENE